MYGSLTAEERNDVYPLFAANANSARCRYDIYLEGHVRAVQRGQAAQLEVDGHSSTYTRFTGCPSPIPSPMIALGQGESKITSVSLTRSLTVSS